MPFLFFLFLFIFKTFNCPLFPFLFLNPTATIITNNHPTSSMPFNHNPHFHFHVSLPHPHLHLPASFHKMEHETGDSKQKSESKYECLLFDVDDTLYPLTSGLSTECTNNIKEYMVTKLEIEETKVPEMCDKLYREYGTTMSGLCAVGYDFDYDEYHRFVHGRLPYELLKPDPILRSLLTSMPLRKVIFTNANEAHVAEVLGRLGLEDCFDDVICFETLNGYNDANDTPETYVNEPKSPVVCKPTENAFQQAFKMAKINPHKTLFFDDSIRNIQTAKLMGLDTVLVGSSERIDGADYALKSIHDVKEAVPEIWDSVNKDVRLS